MFKRDQILQSPADFDNAVLFGTPIIVWQNDEIIDYGGPIKHHTGDTVFINDGYFLKATCEFRVR